MIYSAHGNEVTHISCYDPITETISIQINSAGCSNHWFHNYSIHKLQTDSRREIIDMLDFLTINIFYNNIAFYYEKTWNALPVWIVNKQGKQISFLIEREY